MANREAYIVSAARTACGKANRGSLRHTWPDSLGGYAIKAAIQRAGGLDPAEVEDVIMGCAFPEGAQGLNVARQCAILGGIPAEVPAVTINRFCSSGLQAIAMAAERIMSGGADVILAGGVESMSMVPMGGLSIQPNPELVEKYPEIYISMGITAENVASKYKISREDQDAFALGSHQKAIQAIQGGKFKDQIIPVKVSEVTIDKNGERTEKTFDFDTDEGPRADTDAAKLAKLKPVFQVGGTVTAGNSSQMNDAAAAVVVMSGERVKSGGYTPLARFVGFDTAGVRPEIMGIGPVEAVPKVLKRAGLKLKDIGLTELNEAFGAQALAVIRTLGLDPETINIHGGAIAMGHPLGCTGAKLSTQILYAMKSAKIRYGMVTMCVGGGMGAAGIFELS